MRYLIQPQTRPDLETLDIVSWRAGNRNMVVQAGDPDALWNGFVPLENLLIHTREIFALQISDERRVEVVHQAPDLGTQFRKVDQTVQIGMLLLRNKSASPTYQLHGQTSWTHRIRQARVDLVIMNHEGEASTKAPSAI